MKRHWISVLGLSAVLMVTLAVGRLVGAQETEKCDGCAGWTQLDAKIKDWGGWIDYGKTKHGIAAVALTSTPEKGGAILAAFQEFDKMTHSEGMKSCGMCKDMEKLSKSKGTIVEVVPLKTGAIYLVTSTKPKTVQALHAMYDKGCEQMEKAAAAACCADKTLCTKECSHNEKGAADCCKKSEVEKCCAKKDDGKIEKSELEKTDDSN